MLVIYLSFYELGDGYTGPTKRDKGIRISEDITEQCLLSVTKTK